MTKQVNYFLTFALALFAVFAFAVAFVFAVFVFAAVFVFVAVFVSAVFVFAGSALAGRAPLNSFGFSTTFCAR